MENQYNLLAELMSDFNSDNFIVVRFRGIDKAAISERVDYGNNSILVAYEKIKNRLESENACIVDTTIRPRRERYLFDMDAVNEVLLNALVHNDYRITQPLIAIYEDRLEFTSHGGMPSGLTEEEFFMGISKPRNASLMEILACLGIVERTGYGIPMVIKKYGKEAFDIHDTFISVIILFDKEARKLRGANSDVNDDANDVAKNTAVSNGALSEAERMIVNQLIVNPLSTTNDISLACGIPFRSVQRATGYCKA